MSPRALITGASGFIGACLTKHLLKHGWEVHLLARHDSKLEELSHNTQQLTIHRIDGSYESIALALKAGRPDLVFHLASLFLAQHKPTDINNLIESNILFPTLLLEAMQHCGIKHFVNTGTSWQHYKNQDYCPVNLYAATKESFERLIQFYVDAHGFRVKTLQLFDTYGPGDHRKKLFYALRKAARSGETLNMSPGEQQINLVYGGDVAEAFRLAGLQLLESTGTCNEVYGVANEISTTLRELVNDYSKISNFKINVNWGALPYRPREVMSTWSNYQTIPLWQPSTSLAAGITQMESDNSIQGLLSTKN